MIRNGARSRGTIPDNAPEDAETGTAIGGEGGASPVIDPNLMRDLARLLGETDLAELEVEKGDLRVRMVRYSPAPVPVASPAAMPASFPVPAATVAVSAAAAPAPADADHPGAVKSPMVGTAYRRSKPEAAPFVEIGSVVKAGDKVMLVEAMKTFNDIVAPRAGTVTAIFIDDGQPVEYGEPLLVIE